MSYSDNIKKLRIERGMTQEDLAKACGYKSKASISKIESGTTDPGQSALVKIAKALNVSVAQLIIEDNEAIGDKEIGANQEVDWLSTLDQRPPIAKSINKLMRDNGVSNTRLADYLSVSESTVSRWRNGESIPRMQTIHKIADFFKVPADFITRGIAGQSYSKQGAKIPVLGEIAGGLPIEVWDAVANDQYIDLDDPDSWEDIPASWLYGDRQFLALRISGDSMDPIISNGDIAIVERCYEWHNGSVMAVYVNGYNATLKRIRVDQNGILMLESFNPSYETQVYTPQQQKELPVQPLGILVESRKKWR